MTESEKLVTGVETEAILKSTTARESWRIFGIMSEFVEATERLAAIKPAVTIFGSARVRPESPYYMLAEETARLLSDSGFSVISGGGPGIMEAANRGAVESGAPTIGFNITLPQEQLPNAWTTPTLTFRFHYFAMRKMHLAMRANALVVFPGGFGTMDELFEMLTLRQTNKVPRMPVVLVDQAYWQSVVDFRQFAAHGMVDNEDLALFRYAEDAEGIWQQLLELGLKVPGATGT